MLFRHLLIYITTRIGGLSVLRDDQLFYQMGYDGVLQFFYDSEENIFYDQCGIRVVNIFEALTPNDIFLFKQDLGYNIFRYREDPSIICEILSDYGES